MPRVLISDKLPAAGLDLLRQAGIEIDDRQKLKGAELQEALRGADGVIVRSDTRITAAELENPGRLRVIVRAGVGVDNIDVAAATRKGIVVMNTPGGNTVSTAEQTITLLMALARHMPAADASLRQGKWEQQQIRRHPTRRQDARRRRPGPHRPRGRPAGRRPGHEDPRLRSVPRLRRRRPDGHRDRLRSRCTVAARRFPDGPHAADRRDARSARRTAAGAVAEGSARHQLRARRHHQRGGAGRGAAFGPSRRGGARCLRAGTAAGRSSAAPTAQRRRHAAPGRLDRGSASIGGQGSRPVDRRLSRPRRHRLRRQHGRRGSRPNWTSCGSTSIWLAVWDCCTRK